MSSGPIGSARDEESASSRPRRGPWAVALIAAWVLLVAAFGAGAGYVWWPTLEPQARALLGQERPLEVAALPEVEVAPHAQAPDEIASDEATPQLDLAEPQATPLPSSETLPSSATEPSPAPLPTSEPLPPADGAGIQPQRPAAETAPGVAPAQSEAGAPQAPGGSDTPAPQVAGLPQLPPAPAPPQLPAWQQFAMPFTPPPERPLIAIVITGLGLNGPRTLQAIEQLPPEISLSFSPYGKQTEEFMRTARAFGHEVLLDLPMEPEGADDPGTLALLTTVGQGMNLDRLDLVLSRGRGYVGVVGAMGARFVSDPLALDPVMGELAARGLLYVDNRPLDEPMAAQAAAAAGVPVAVNDRSLDARMASTPAVDASLAQVERMARERGTAVALGQPNPTTLEELADWVKSLPGKGLALAPISAVANTQPIR